jgi:ubiquinone/menaquinone biosynthesis C-methylase UbiE
VVEKYEAWYGGPGRRADRLEKELLIRLLNWIDDGQSLLDVGSGTGHFTRLFNGTGLHVVGLDISLPMVREAARLGSPPSVLGDALNLPYDDQSFDVVTIVATLEFVNSPLRVITEAARVARRGLLIGTLNRASVLGLRARGATGDPWAAAKLLTVRELRRCISTLCKNRRHSVTWLTTLWPGYSKALHLPWGDFIGMAVRWEAQPGEGQRP